ncbi:UNVERIFIED_CONTAM: arm repeat protein interacting with a [Sesamum angustifolium]|uniref:Arm repeat protein interacting with a n=1 Tax=Sesamum angustifolium TaxID=2727405 RepID=A0AAW2QTZ3_9LAMI
MENRKQNSGRRRREQTSSTSLSSRRSVKRKLGEEFDEDYGRAGDESPVDSHQDLVREVRTQVDILDSAFSYAEEDRAAAKKATSVLSELAKNEDIVNVIVDCEAIPSLVRHLQAPPPVREGDSGPRPYEHEVEKGSAFALGFLAIKPEHQQLIVDAGALPPLVDLLMRHRNALNSRAVGVIGNLVHSSPNIKKEVLAAGALQPVIGLLRSRCSESKEKLLCCLGNLLQQIQIVHIVQRAAVPPLIEMLHSPDAQLKEMSAFALGRLAQDNVADLI